MKKLTTLIAILLYAVSLFAQAPEKFSYQAVVRNASNALLANAQVGVRVNILQGSATGNAVYSESHMATTNANGLITVNIGGGSVLHGTFADIDWSDGPYFLKTDIDPNGGNDYSITSVQQLLSVPYALYAKDAGNGFSGDYNDLVNVPQIPADISAFNNDAGYITGYTETDPQYNAWNKDYNDLINKPTIPTVPTNVSAFTNDAGYLSSYTETDPQFNAWDKDYNDLINTPTIPTVPTNVGAFTNDAGYLTSYTETDPQFNAWDKDYNDLINKPIIPTVPTNVSAFTNDAGYLTSYTETDPQFNAWDKDYNDLINKPIIPTVPTDVSAFTNDAGYLSSYTETDPQFNAWDKDYNDLINKPTIPTVPTNVGAFTNDAGYLTSYTETDPQFNAWNKDYNDLINTPVIPTVPTIVSAFENDAHYITEGELQQTVNDMDNTIDSLRTRIEELEGHNTPPSVMTTGISDVAYLSATVNGSVVYIGGAPVVAKGFCYDTLMHPTVESTTVSCGSGSGNFSTNLLNLTSSTTYYVRAYATNMWGTNYGEEKVFTTLTEHAPSVEIVPATEISFTSFICGGDVTDSGTYAVTARGLCWSTAPDPVMTGDHLHLGNGAGTFSAMLVNMQPETTYYVRAYAVNAVSVTYSNAITVTTLTPTLPTVTTDSVSDYNECIATVVSDGGAPVTQRGFCYDTLPNPTLENNVVYVDGGEGEFTATLMGLPVGKLYFVRAFATNAKGTTYGNQFDFYGGCDSKTITDYDGNVYNTVLIGNQCWMKENLRTTHYSDGWPIEQSQTITLKTPYYVYPENNPNLFELYGLLYNLSAAMREDLTYTVPSGGQGICPVGWHLPSENEWRLLTNYVGMNMSQYSTTDGCSSNAKALADSLGWSTSDDSCSIGLDSQYNNTTGFSARAAGEGYLWSSTWHLNHVGIEGKYWSSSISSSGISFIVLFYYGDSSVNLLSGQDKRFFCSVRCLRD